MAVVILITSTPNTFLKLVNSHELCCHHFIVHGIELFMNQTSKLQTFKSSQTTMKRTISYPKSKSKQHHKFQASFEDFIHVTRLLIKITFTTKFGMIQARKPQPQSWDEISRQATTRSLLMFFNYPKDLISNLLSIYSKTSQ